MCTRDYRREPMFTEAQILGLVVRSTNVRTGLSEFDEGATQRIRDRMRKSTRLVCSRCGKPPCCDPYY